jgi:hypothetical protein
VAPRPACRHAPRARRKPRRARPLGEPGQSPAEPRRDCATATSSSASTAVPLAVGRTRCTSRSTRTRIHATARSSCCAAIASPQVLFLSIRPIRADRLKVPHLRAFHRGAKRCAASESRITTLGDSHGRSERKRSRGARHRRHGRAGRDDLDQDGRRRVPGRRHLLAGQQDVREWLARKKRAATS